MPIDPTKIPSREEMERLHEHYMETWKNAHAQWREDDKYFKREFALWDGVANETVRAGRASVHPSAPTDIINHAADTLLTFDPYVHRAPTSKSEDSKIAADNVEAAMQEIIPDAFLMEMMGHPAKLGGRYLIQYGYTPQFTGLDLTAINGKPQLKKGEAKEDYEYRLEEWNFHRYGWNPIRMPTPHPSQVLMEPLEKNPAIALHQRSMLAMDVHDLTVQKSKTRQGVYVWDMGETDPYEIMPILEFWSAYQHVVKLQDGEILYAERNMWGIQPFQHTFAGFSQLSMMDSRDKCDPSELAVGMLHPVKPLLKALAQLVSAEMQSVIRAAYAKRGFAGDEQQAVQQLIGDIISGEEGDWWLEKLPTLPQNITELRSWIETAIERGTFSMQMAGFRQVGIETATQQVILSEASLRKFATMLNQLDYMYSIAGSNILKLATKLKNAYGIETINVGTRALKVADIDNNFRISVTFEQIDQNALRLERQSAMDEFRTGLTSKDDYWTVARVEDKSGRRTRILEDAVEQTPEVVAYAAEQTQKRLGIDKMVKRMKQEAQEAEQQANPVFASPEGQPVQPTPQVPYGEE
jgi:hypothetical protein